MATVKKSFSFSCPKCDKTLRTAVRPAEGKKIKCPACGKPFIPEIEDEEEETRIQKKTTLKVKTNASKTGAKKQRVEEDDDEERPTPKKKKAGSNMILIVLLVLLGGGMLGSIGLCAGAAFVWPGFLKSDTKIAEAKKDATKTEETKTDDAKKADDAKQGGDAKKDNEKKDADAKKKDDDAKKKDDDAKKKDETKKAPKLQKNDTLEAFIPSGATILIGANLKPLRDQGQIENIIKNLTGLDTGVGGIPDVFLDLARESERIVFAAVDEKQKPLVIVRFATPVGLAKFKKGVDLTKEEMLEDRYAIYRSDGKKQPETIYFPGERTAVLTDLGDEDLTKILRAAEKTPVPESPAAALAKSVDKAHVWGAVVFDDNMRLQAGGFAGDLAKAFEQLKPASAPLERAKGATLAVDFRSASSYAVRANIECADRNDAITLTGAGDAFRSAFIKAFLDGQGATASFLARADLNSFRVRSTGSTASVEFSFSMQSYQELAKLMSTVPRKDGPKDLASKDGPPFPPKDGTFPPKDGTFPPKDGPFPPKDLAMKDKKDPFPPRDGPFPPKVDVIISTTAIALVQEFRANPQAAQEKYRNKQVEVSGKVIGATPTGDFVVLDAGEKIGGPVAPKHVTGTRFDKASAAELGKLQNGQIIAFRGQFNNDVGNIALVNCQLVGVQPGKDPPKDFAGKDPPKFVPGQPIAQGGFPSIAPNGTQEFPLKLEKGQSVTLTMACQILAAKTPIAKGGFKVDPRPTNVKIEVHRGAAGGPTVAQTTSTGGISRLEFTAGDSETFRVRIHNSGPGTAFQVVINVVNK